MAKTSIIRIILGSIGAILALILLAVVVLVLMPADRLAQVAIDRIANETGREITIMGADRPTLWPGLSITVSGLEVANPDWAGSRPLLRAETATLQVGWEALFGGGEGRVDRLDLRGVDMTLVRAADGRLSWRNGAASLLPLALERAEIEGGRLRYLDRAAGTTLDIRRIAATVDLDEGASGAAAFAASGVANATMMELSGTITQAAHFFDGTPQSIRMDLVWGTGSLRFNGEAALGHGAEGQLDLQAQDLVPLVRLVRSEVPDLVGRLAGQAVTVEGAMSMAEAGSLHLRDGTIALGNTRLNAALDLVPGEDRPFLRGTITGGEIALGDGVAATAFAPEGAWSQAPLDVSGLFAVDADLTVRAGRLRVGRLALDGLDLRAELSRGRVVFDIARVGLADGQLAGEFVINGRGGLSVGGDLLLANAEAVPLLETLFGSAPLGGRGSAAVEFLGVGDDLATIIGGLEAEGDISISRGTFRHVDLRGLALNAPDPETATDFDRLLAEFRIRGGVVISEDLLLDGPWGGFDGTGRVDLAERSLDYRLIPRNWPEREVPVPVVIEGPWEALTAAPDAEVLEALAAQAAAERARAAEVARLLGGPIEVEAAPDDVVEETEE